MVHRRKNVPRPSCSCPPRTCRMLCSLPLRRSPPRTRGFREQPNGLPWTVRILPGRTSEARSFWCLSERCATRTAAKRSRPRSSVRSADRRDCWRPHRRDMAILKGAGFRSEDAVRLREDGNKGGCSKGKYCRQGRSRHESRAIVPGKRCATEDAACSDRIGKPRRHTGCCQSS